MAYKFQLGNTLLSGSTTFKEAVDVESLKLENGESIGAGSDPDMMTFTQNSSIVLANNLDFNVAKAGGLQLGGTSVSATAAELNYLDNDDLTSADFVKLAAVDASAAELNLVDGSSAGTIVNSKAVVYGSGGEVNATVLQVGGAAITSTPAELNLLDGVAGLVQADFTKLAAVDASAAELNYLDNDDLTSADFVKLAAVDASAAELNLVDGSSAGTIVNSKAVIYGSGGEVNATALQVGGVAITSTPAELNLLDGVSGLVKADFTKLAAVEASDTELNVLDGFAEAVYDKSADSVVFLDATDSKLKTESANDFVSTIAGKALVPDSGALKVALSGAISYASGGDAVGLSGSIAGAGLTFAGGAKSISKLDVAVDGSSIEISSDSLRVKAGGITTAMLDSDAVDGSKLADDSVDSEHFVDGSIDTAHLGDAQVTEAKLATSVAGLGISGGAGSALAVDLNQLSGADAMDTGADSIVFIDATDNVSKKESMADFLTSIAGAGISAGSGKLGIDGNSVTQKDFSNPVSLSSGYNVPTADSMSGACTATLPAPTEDGYMVAIKAPSDCSPTNHIVIAGGTIDGETTIRLESPRAAVTLICIDAGGDQWIVM